MTVRIYIRMFFLMALLCISGGSNVVYAQYNKNKKSEFTGIERWAFKTNIIDWAATIPNFSVEYDLSGAENNKMTLGLTARCNWNTYHNNAPYYIFDLWQIRPEYRYYWRATNGTRGPARDKDGKRIGERRSFSQWLREDVFTTVRRNPRKNHINYIGAYVDAGRYNIKTGEYGHRGQLYTLGLSMGYGMPKYQYKTGYIDIELGFAVGLALTTNHIFTLDRDANTYKEIPSKCEGFRVAPFPVVSSLNLSFAWRGKSIKDKYKFTDADRIRKQDKDAEWKARQEEKKLKKEQRQTEKEQRQTEKEQEKKNTEP